MTHKYNSAALEELADNFDLFDDWEERYRYLIDLGRSLPLMPEDLKTDGNLVKGCTSRVWLAETVEDNVLRFQADSDAHIVRGLIAVLDRAYNGVSLPDIQSIDVDGAFAAMGLDKNLSPNRRNGFFSMVKRVLSLV